MTTRATAGRFVYVVLWSLLAAWPAVAQPASGPTQHAGMVPNAGPLANAPMGDTGQMCPPQCGQMMEKEMHAYPWKMAGVTTLGVLVGIALLLLIALELQWLKLWSHRVRLERTVGAETAASSVRPPAAP